VRQERRKLDELRETEARLMAQEADDAVADQLRAIRLDIAAATEDLDAQIEQTRERARRLERFEKREGGP